jgi:hypothetical protein
MTPGAAIRPCRWTINAFLEKKVLKKYLYIYNNNNNNNNKEIEKKIKEEPDQF